mmetsp:Transcript_66450/g.216249  ORF Transcript_66450/g.216249 Transcript_66450/m.216249 type:complete len:302 (-) Transcript_66450:196-1101(-)
MQDPAGGVIAEIRTVLRICVELLEGINLMHGGKGVPCNGSTQLPEGHRERQPTDRTHCHIPAPRTPPLCASRWARSPLSNPTTPRNTVRLTNTGPLGMTQCCIGSSNYMRGMDQCPVTGCPEPIDTLIEAVKGLNVIKYAQLNMTTQRSIPPVVPLGMWSPDIQGGGVQNTAFVNLNAMAESRSFKNLVWLLTVQNPDGSTYQLMQYIQTVNLKFLAAGPGCPDQVWPHVDANTLHRMNMPPTPTPTPTPNEAGNCFTKCCGCPGHFKEPWCSKVTSFMGPLCSNSKTSCHMCGGEWCTTS